MNKKVKIFLLLCMFCLPQLWAEKILIVRPDLEQFEKVADKTKAELGKQVSFETLLLEKDSNYEDFEVAVRKAKPDLLLLLDNKAVNYAMQFNKEADAYAKGLRGVAAMALNMRNILAESPNICGVEYEVPAYSLFTQYRNLTTKDLNKILVFYRKSPHQKLIDETRSQLKLEKIELVAINVEKETKDETIRNVKAVVKRESKRKDIDVIWVMPDNVIVNNSTIRSWVRAAGKHEKPFVSTIDFLVSKMDFCAYATAPNLKTLSLQLSDMCIAILEDGESPNELGVEYIRSVHRIVNARKFRKMRIKLDAEQLKHCEVVR